MREYLTASILANNVRLLRDVHRGVIVVVEDGGSATLAKSTLLDKYAVQVLVCHGKANVYAVLAELATDDALVGLVDADYERVLGRRPPARCLWFDHRDLEVSLVCSGAFDRVVAEHSGEIEPGQLRSDLLAAAAAFACWRVASVLAGARLSFEGLRPEEYYEASSRSVSSEEVHTWVRERNGDRYADVVPVDSSLYDLRDIVRGHDLTALAAAQLRHDCSAEVGAGDIERELRLAARFEDFLNSSLLAAARELEERLPSSLLASY